MFKKFTAAAITIAFLSSGAIAAERPGDALPSLAPLQAAAPVQLAQNDTQGASQSSLPADARAEPKKKKKRRFFGLPLWGLGSLLAAGGGLAALGTGQNGTSP